MQKDFLSNSEILRPFFNLLTLNDKYSVGNREILTQPIQTQLSKKRQIFSDFSTGFQKSTYEFGLFQNIDDPDRLCISEIIDLETSGT